MFVFIVANLPLPIIIFLNLKVTWRFLKVRHLSRTISIDKPERLVVGWWLNNLAMIFIYTPMLAERRFFVQNRWWIISYIIAAALSITGLLLMNSGLGEELHELIRRSRRKHSPTAVDRKASDKL